MRKLRDLMFALSVLRDWQRELDDAYAVAEENKVRYSDWLGALEPEAPGEKDALVLDLAEYRALKASA